MIYKNHELKSMIRFMDANKKEWLDDNQKDGEPYKVQSYSHLLQLVDTNFYIEHKLSSCLCIEKRYLYPEEVR